ncbi:hypothetical protein [Kitasatospora sp. GAS204B]|uniref:hypothetical protein n=1 Tax=unclassified Kitasatospora TaxID=2633591 RepID=UPI002473CB42|nr:hypothetical protein [Kitasatospora sp. GAS204B]MDH6118355.1 hypothetical protein [Kitasatospora sp. GAS204B]
MRVRSGPGRPDLAWWSERPGADAASGPANARRAPAAGAAAGLAFAALELRPGASLFSRWTDPRGTTP